MLQVNGWKKVDKLQKNVTSPNMKQPAIQSISGPYQLLVVKGEKREVDMMGPRMSVVVCGKLSGFVDVERLVIEEGGEFDGNAFAREANMNGVTRGSLCVKESIVCGPMCDINGKVSFGAIILQKNGRASLNGLLVSNLISPNGGEEGVEGVTSTGNECYPPPLPSNYFPEDFTSHIQKDSVSASPQFHSNNPHLSIGVSGGVDNGSDSMRSAGSDKTYCHNWSVSEVNPERPNLTTPTDTYCTNNINIIQDLKARKRSDWAQHAVSHQISGLTSSQYVAQGVSNPSAVQNSQISSVVPKPEQKEAGKMVKKLEEKELKAESRAARRPSILREMLIRFSSPIQRKGKSTDKSSPSRWRRKSDIALSFPERTSSDMLCNVSDPETAPILQEAVNVSESQTGLISSKQSDSEANDDQRACSHQSIAASRKISSSSKLTPDMEEGLNGGHIVNNLELPLNQESVVKKESNKVVQQFSPCLTSPAMDTTMPFLFHESEPSKSTLQRKEGDESLLQETEKSTDNKHNNHMSSSSLSQTYSSESSSQNKLITKKMERSSQNSEIRLSNHSLDLTASHIPLQAVSSFAAAPVLTSPMHANAPGDASFSTDVVEAEARIDGAPPTRVHSLRNTYCNNGSVRTDDDDMTTDHHGTNNESDGDAIVKYSPRLSPSSKISPSITDLYAGSGSEGESDDSSNMVTNIRNVFESEGEKSSGKHSHYINTFRLKKRNGKSNEQDTKCTNKEHCRLGKCNESSTSGSPGSSGEMDSNGGRTTRDRMRLAHFQRIAQSRKNIGVLDNLKFLR